MQQLKKIVVIGPESTGKSTLCAQLAAHYGTDWVKEYAREYLLRHGMEYGFDDLLTIAKGQVRLEEEAVAGLQKRYHEWRTVMKTAIRGNSQTASKATASNSTPPIPLFIDTDMQVMQVWSQFVFGRTHAWIEEQLQQRKYDLYLLCNTDLPWVKDELREYPDVATREKLFHIYKERMLNQSVPWVEIIGTDAERLQQAVAAVDRVLL